MRIWWAGLVLAACGGGGDATTSSHPSGSTLPLPDGTLEAVSICDPAAQTGCDALEKCTWIIDQDGDATTDDIAHTGCAPAGTVAVGGACHEAVGTTGGGVDECIAGSICEDGICRQICDATTSCGANHACTRFANVFYQSEIWLAGICEPACDPLTWQSRETGHAACDSPDPSAPTRGCFYEDAAFVCGPTSPAHADATDRVSAPALRANACAPGYAPLLQKSLLDATPVCVGICAPRPANDVAQDAAIGDAQALAASSDDPTPAAGHGTCAVRGASTDGAEDCAFLWTIQFDANLTPIPSAYGDTAGYCLPDAQYDFDPTGGPDPSTPLASCKEWPPRSGATTGPADDAEDFGCNTAAASAPALAVRTRPAYGTDNAGDAPMLGRKRL